MKTSESVLEFLRTQGFCPEVDEHGGIIFKYQMATFLFINNDEDTDSRSHQQDQLQHESGKIMCHQRECVGIL